MKKRVVVGYKTTLNIYLNIFCVHILFHMTLAKTALRFTSSRRLMLAMRTMLRTLLPASQDFSERGARSAIEVDRAEFITI